MTTTVVNNSLFRTFFEKQKLTGNNFMEWYCNLRIVLSTGDKLPFMEQPILTLPVPPEGQAHPSDVVTTHQALVKAQKKIARLMLMTMDPDIQKNLKLLGAYDMLKELKTFLILVSLRKEYDSFVQNYNMHSMGKTVTELHAMLKLHEQTTPPKEVAHALHAIRAGRIQKNQKKKSHKATKGNQGKGKAKMGNALVPAPSYAPKPNNPSTPKKDNPAKDTATNVGLRGSRKLKPGALSVYVGDGHCAGVNAIGEFHLCLPSRLVLILHNCHYAPSITRGIVLVLRLHKDGFVNRFENDNSINVSKNNLIYSNAIPRDDIYEIVLSNANDISMYAISNKRAKLNLNSDLLWHCRLGHINKKCTEKLQQDGLLDSTDFEKYVTCMSGKMARKPYSHQVERAKDLLGLIHTDYYALESAARILNMVLTKKVDKTPYEVWHEQAPKLSYLKVWGCEALVKRDTLTKPEKLEPRALKCIFVGYLEETMGYSFYYPPKNKVFVARNVEFFENDVIDHEASGSLEVLKIIQEEDTHPSLDTSLDHKEDDQEINKPQRDLGEPANYKAALLDPESDKWLNAMNVEMRSIKDNKVWELVYLPSDVKTIDIRAIRILIAIAAFYDCEIWQLDVKTAFLNGYLNEEVYMEQPGGFVSQKFPNRNPSDAHWTAVKNILKYFRNTKDMFFVYGGDTKRELRVSCYTDVGYLTDADDMKSQTGYVFVLNGGAIDWKSTKQSIFATLSTEAEYISAFDASKEAVWIRKFISGLGAFPTIEEPINMYCDNTGAKRKIMESLKVQDIFAQKFTIFEKPKKWVMQR
nr:hypothetical protein [Tanacetum cinerariifolium]